jgi:hypothetical protein
MNIKQWIRNWLNSDGVGLKVSSRPIESDGSSDQTGISISNAINGKVLTLRTYQPNRTSNGRHAQSDWVTEYYVIKEGESLTEALTMLLVMRGIDK